MSKCLIACIDFDGTIVDHRYPDIGDPVPHAIEWLKRLQAHGVRLILWTMRSDGRPDGTDPLAEAVAYCRENGVEFWGVNENPEQKGWTSSPKAYAPVYVDDAAVGCPLLQNPRYDGRPYVDWDRAGPLVLAALGLHSPAMQGMP